MSEQVQAPAQDAAPPQPSVAERALGFLASPFTGFATAVGEHLILLGQAFAWLVRPPFRARLVFDQMEFVGVGSLPIVTLVGFFTGAVTAFQAVLALAIFQQQRWVGFGVGISLAWELAPVFTALMITARAGSAMATELGSMRVTEQIDALTTFAVSPVQYLVTPRVLASLIMLPVMTMVFNVIGLFGCYCVAIIWKGVDYGQAAELFRTRIEPLDYFRGLIKALAFGLTMATTACYQGFNVRGGAKEVGRATTRAVVYSSVCILVLDFFILVVLNDIWPVQE